MLQYFVAIHVRHHDVEQHEVKGVYLQHFQGLPPVFGGGYHVAMTFQLARHHVAIGFDVIDDQQESLCCAGGQFARRRVFQGCFGG